MTQFSRTEKKKMMGHVLVFEKVTIYLYAEVQP